MKDDADSLKAQLRQIDDYERKGLLRAEEAAASRAAAQRRLMQLLMPDTPAPRLPWRAHLWALVAMAVLVGSVSAYLISGHAGLRRRSEELLAAAKVAAAQDAAAKRERLARIRAGQSLAPDADGVFRSGAPGASSAAGGDAVAPLLAGHVELDPDLAGGAAPDDALFIVVRLPGDPDGLPLAAIRKRVGDLPLDFRIGERELVGAAQRFMQAPAVIVSARISKSGSGRAQAGDLVGSAPSVVPWTRGVLVVIDRRVP